VQHLHAVAEEDLGLELGRAVGGEQVVQVEAQRRVRDALAARVVRRQADVAPAEIRRHLVEEQVQAVRLRLPGQQHAVGRECRDRDVPRELVVDDAVVQDVLEHGGHRREGERVAHDRRIPSRNASSDSGRARGARVAAGAGCSARAIVARTSIRPILTCTTSDVARGARRSGAARAGSGAGRTTRGRSACDGGASTGDTAGGGAGPASAGSGTCARRSGGA
jgi:hypothetical protein